MAKMRKKSELPEKICAACMRPFSWRKKWERDWENVRFCSDKCRAAGATSDPAGAQPNNDVGRVQRSSASRGRPA